VVNIFYEGPHWKLHCYSGPHLLHCLLHCLWKEIFSKNRIRH